MDKFEKYSSLTNHYQEKFINAIIMNGLDKGEWVAQEKVHGANFSFHFDGTEHKQAKRSSFCDENFFNCGSILKYRPSIEMIYKVLEEYKLIDKGDTIVVFGEIFGGNYKGQKEPNAKTVQGGMQYHPDNEFMAFDIKVNGSFLPFMEVENLCKVSRLPLAPVVAYGDFQEMLEVNNEFDSYVPEDLGLEKVEGGIAEGLVIRPYLDEKDFKGTRLLIKSKNSKFSEVARKAKTVKKSVKLNDDETAVLENFSRYFTANRVDATISKHGEIVWKDFAKIAGLVFQDAMEDYNKDVFNRLDDDRTLKKVLGDSWTAFGKHAKMASDEVVRDRFKEIL
tara:strand:+ start:16588 stop:17595 length:1008 start_codon:yes stop_codon:yes gene_type:complete